MRKALAWLVSVIAACGGSESGLQVDAPGDLGNVPGQPGVGAHELALYRLFESQSTTLSTAAMRTAPAGSTLLVSVGRGQLGAHELPTDNKGNTAVQLDTAHNYTRWQSSGTALYAFTGMTGGADHVIRAGTPAEDEVTLAAVEVLNGRRIAQTVWREALEPPHTTLSVTTAGPATLVAFWWGDADVDGEKTSVPNNGFTVVESVLRAGALVQCAVAVKNVSAAGTYDVTWTATPNQGAQLWLVAVE